MDVKFVDGRFVASAGAVKVGGVLVTELAVVSKGVLLVTGVVAVWGGVAGVGAVTGPAALGFSNPFSNSLLVRWW